MSNCIEIYNHVQPTKELEIIYMKNDKKNPFANWSVFQQNFHMLLCEVYFWLE